MHTTTQKMTFNVVSAAFIKEGNSCDLFRFVCTRKKEEKIRLADNSVACEAIALISGFQALKMH